MTDNKNALSLTQQFRRDRLTHSLFNWRSGVVALGTIGGAVAATTVMPVAVAVVLVGDPPGRASMLDDPCDVCLIATAVSIAESDASQQLEHRAQPSR